jgi:hypothetical protein
VNVTIEWQPENALEPIESTEEGMQIAANITHWKKANASIPLSSDPPSNVTCWRNLHFAKHFKENM